MYKKKPASDKGGHQKSTDFQRMTTGPAQELLLRCSGADTTSQLCLSVASDMSFTILGIEFSHATWDARVT